MEQQLDVKKTKQSDVFDLIRYTDNLPTGEICDPLGGEYTTCTFCGYYMDTDHEDYPFKLEEDNDLCGQLLWCPDCHHLTYDYCCRDTDTGCGDTFEFPCTVIGIQLPDGRSYKGTPVISPELIKQFVYAIQNINRSCLTIYCGCNTKCMNDKCCKTGKPGLSPYVYRRRPTKWVLDGLISRGVND